MGQDLRLEGGVEGGREAWPSGAGAVQIEASLPGGRSLGNRNLGQSWGLAATQRGFLPIPALQSQEAGSGENPDSE